MVTEIADIHITPGQEDEFLSAYREARHNVAQSPGLRNMRMTRSVESPSRFVLLIEWDSIEAHDQGFRQTERFDAWREAIGGYFAEAPKVEHLSDID
ncbi:antibiotic biosynthesis monooxygenase family protein [Haloglycomyces albus]|uniref:antibiotic biosynthesis monooxygenase family protein n=1 Tax=Haloglycomyces albus TaxID=526067 RepID=UPI00046D8B6F|nr:antibiotic biosynthesis monooxygenase [Haloglycomyces albus]